MRYINLNNAGSSKPYSGVNKEIKKYLDAEEKFGGYFAAEKFKNKINLFYMNLAKLINCQKSELSFLQSSTVAWNIFFNSIKLKSKDNIIIFDNEYGSNLIHFIQKKCQTKIVKIKDDGNICFDDLKKKVDKNTKIVCLCHIASQCGEIMPASSIGKIVRKINPEILYIVDACQSIGHINVDVKEIDCDVLVGSGRKYLRGPRGTGFIYLKNNLRKHVQPLIQDLHNAKIRENRIKIADSQIFENFEYSPALKIGLNTSLEKINSFGIENIEKSIRKKSLFLRNELKKIKKIRFFENKEFISGINTLIIKGHKPKEVYNYLLSKKILISLSTEATSPTYFNKKKIKSLIRVSIHEYNKFSEITYLIKCLIDLIKK